MAITTSFDPYTAEVIAPGQVCQPIDDFPDTFLVTFQGRTFDVLVDTYSPTHLVNLQIEETSAHNAASTVGQALAWTYQGHRLGAYLSPVGAAGAVAVMEKAIAYGASRFVVFGSCGVLVPGLPGDSLILPTAAYRDEGTSYHYARSSDYMALASHQQTAAILRQLKVPYVTGRVWTTDAFYRETEGNLAKRVREGCIAVDMETSALAALAEFRGVAVHQFLYQADALSGEAWDPGTLGHLPAEPRARYIQIAAEIALRLGQ